MKRFFSVPSAERKALAQAEEGKKLKEFALHHFNELKKINPSATLEDDFPENVFPFALKLRLCWVVSIPFGFPLT